MSNSTSSNNNNNDGEALNIYGYTPSLAAAIIFIILFSFLTLGHAILVYISRIWWLVIMVVGGITEIIGWVGRAISSQDPTDVNGFLMQQVCLILAPCFFSGALYAITGRLVLALGPKYSRLRPNLYLWVFCICDLIAIVVQAIGGGSAAVALQNEKESVTGTHIMVAGIVAQLASMIVFCILILDFYIKARKDPVYKNKSGEDQSKIKRLVFGIFFASGWILIRCIYRTVELAQGWSGYLITHEGYFIGLDSVPMVLTMATLIYAHPHYCLPRNSPSFNDQNKELEAGSNISTRSEQTQFNEGTEKELERN